MTMPELSYRRARVNTLREALPGAFNLAFKPHGSCMITVTCWVRADMAGNWEGHEQAETTWPA